MIAALLLAVQSAPPTAPPAPLPPQDWNMLPSLPFAGLPAGDADLSSFVRAEVRAGHCAAAVQSASGWTLKIDVAVLLGPAGLPRRVLPRAIQCPAVEQYAAGLVSSMARSTRGGAVPPAEGWYKASLTFAWTQ